MEVPVIEVKGRQRKKNPEIWKTNKAEINR